ncbi:MAG: hypothetical protein ACETWG_13395 [Candidatus Neomarinimicrobiota bacterium]
MAGVLCRKYKVSSGREVSIYALSENQLAEIFSLRHKGEAPGEVLARHTQALQVLEERYPGLKQQKVTPNIPILFQKIGDLIGMICYYGLRAKSFEFLNQYSPDELFEISEKIIDLTDMQLTTSPEKD